MLELKGMLLPIGPPAIGKTTLANKLMQSGLKPANFISWDETRLKYCPNSPCSCKNKKDNCLGKENCYCQNTEIFMNIKTRLKNLSKTEKVIYFDGLNLTVSSRKMALNFASENNLNKVALLFPHVSLEELNFRNNQRERTVPSEFLKERYLVHKQLTKEKLLTSGFNEVHVVSEKDTYKL